MVRRENERIRLVVPEIDHEEISAVEEVLKSGYLVQGENVENFERLVADYLGVKHAIAVTSGTSALHLSLIALGIKKGDEVLVPDFTFPATANVVELVGAKPILVDINIDTYNIDASRIEENISSKTKAIIPVHLFGQSADMDDIIEISKAYNLKIIEDAACALGAEYNGRKCGTFGDVGCFSFHPRKAITTGEGGIIVTNDDEIAQNLRVWRNHGMINKQGKYNFVLPGFNYRMTDIQGAIGTVQMQKLDDIIAKKRTLANIYDELLKDLNWVKIPGIAKGVIHVYQSYVVVLDSELGRDSFIVKLRDWGIETTIGTYSLHMLDYYCKKYGYNPEDFPNAKRAFEHGITLPLHSGMSENDVHYVVKNIRNAIND